MILIFAPLLLFSHSFAAKQDSLCQKHFDIAQRLFNEESYKEAAKEFRNAIICKKKSGNNKLYMDYLALSITFLERGEADTAMIFMDTVLFYRNKNRGDSISTAVENNLARINMDKGNYEKSLEHYQIALTNAINEKDSLNQIFINTNLGTLYHRMGKDNLSLKYYLESYRLSKIYDNEEGLAMAYSIGMIYRRRGSLDTAMTFYKGSIPFCKKLGKINDLINIYSNMSNIYMQQERFEDAVNILRKSISLSIENDRKRQLGIAYANMGKAMELSGQNDSSVFYLKKSIVVVSGINSKYLLSQVYKLTSEAYESRNDFENSLFYFKRYKEIADSIFNERAEKQIAELETKYETEKTEKENNLLKADIEFQKKRTNYLIIISIGLVIMGLISLALFYFIRRNNVNKRKLAESEAERLEAELDTQKRELTLAALSLSRNIEFINSLIIELKELSSFVTEKGIPVLNNIVRKFMRQQSDSAWKEFEKRFSDVHSEFYSRLMEKYPKLTQNDMKLCAFLKLGMNTKEICSITFQSVRAVEAGRLRLRKKLSLSKEDNLNQFLQTI